MLEKDLYQPIKEYLENLGYSVKAEVRNLDIMAVKNDTTIVVEMKKGLSLKLLFQGCDRQRIFDNVYIAISNPGSKTRKTKAFKEKLHIIKRLSLGLLLVDIDKSEVEVILDPKKFQPRKNKRKQKLLLEEFASRSSSSNIGGITRQKIMTAYREKVIEIAKTLIDGPLSTKEIRNVTGIANCTNILYKNYYHWFENTERGSYGLTEKGKQELARDINK